MVQQTKPQINNQPKNKPIEKLPVWLMNSERHQVPLTKGRLVQDNLSKFAALVAFLTRITPVYSAKNSPWVRIVELIGLTILIVLSSQVMFLWLMLILMLVHLLIFSADCTNHVKYFHILKYYFLAAIHSRIETITFTECHHSNSRYYNEICLYIRCLYPGIIKQY